LCCLKLKSFALATLLPWRLGARDRRKVWLDGCGSKLLAARVLFWLSFLFVVLCIFCFFLLLGSWKFRTHLCFAFCITDTSAMAVTAPTYVLEESLSTQRLWKDTAGQRPPQPVEERAFYEKMWQQNFARSQVNYSLPVEVLTATSPISLSPFADGNFEGPTEGNELSNYNLASASAKNGASKDVAEAAIFDRMKKPTTTETVNQQKGDLKVLVRGDNVFGTTGRWPSTFHSIIVVLLSNLSSLFVL